MRIIDFYFRASRYVGALILGPYLILAAMLMWVVFALRGKPEFWRRNGVGERSWSEILADPYSGGTSDLRRTRLLVGIVTVVLLVLGVTAMALGAAE